MVRAALVHPPPAAATRASARIPPNLLDDRDLHGNRLSPDFRFVWVSVLARNPVWEFQVPFSINQTTTLSCCSYFLSQVAVFPPEAGLRPRQAEFSPPRSLWGRLPNLRADCSIGAAGRSPPGSFAAPS